MRQRKAANSHTKVALDSLVDKSPCSSTDVKNKSVIISFTTLLVLLSIRWMCMFLYFLYTSHFTALTCLLFSCRRATMEKASATVPSPSVSSWSSGSKAWCSTSPPSTSKGEDAGSRRRTNTLMHLPFPYFSHTASSTESRQTCTTWPRGRTLRSWPSTERSRPISTRSRSSWRKRSALQSNSTGRFHNT